MIGFVRTCPHHRTDVSAPSWSFVRTETGTCSHFLEPEGARFPMCDFASVRVKRTTEGNEQKEKQDRRKENQRKYRQPEKHKSPEKALRGHQLVFWCKEAPSRAIHLTFCQIDKNAFTFLRNRGHPRHPDRGQYNNGRRAWGRWQHTTPWSCLPAASRRCSPPPDGWR